MTPEYDREYGTYFRIAADYGMSGSDGYKLIKKTEDILAISDDFRLPDRKKLAKSNTGIEAVLIDVTGSPTERPEKRQKYYSQVKRRLSLLRMRRPLRYRRRISQTVSGMISEFLKKAD